MVFNCICNLIIEMMMIINLVIWNVFIIGFLVGVKLVFIDFVWF